MARFLSQLGFSICALVCAAHLSAADTPSFGNLRGVNEAHFNQDGTRLIARDRDGKIGLWDVPKGIELPGDLGKKKACVASALSVDGRWLLVGFENGKSRVYKMDTGLAASPWLSAPLRDRFRPQAVFSADGTTVFVFGEKEAQVFSVADGKRLATVAVKFEEDEDAETTAQAIFAKDGSKCFVMDPAGTVTAYGTKDWKPVGEPMKHPAAEAAYVFGFDVSPDAKWITTYDNPGENGPNGNMQVWDAATGKPLGKALTAVNGMVGEFMPGKDRVLASAARGEAVVYDLPAMTKAYAVAPHDDVDGPRITVAPTGQWILSSGPDRSIDLINAATGVREKRDELAAASSQMLFSPDAAHCYVVFDNTAFLLQKHYDYYVLKFRLPDMEVVGSCRFTSFVHHVELSPDGRRLLVREGEDDEQRLQIFDATTMKPFPAKKP